MKKQRKKLSLSQLSLNEGQLGWLPTNPRQWTDGDIKRTAASIKEDTDFLEDRPILVVPDETGSGYVVFAGNLRYTGAKEAGLSEVPCVIHTIEDEETDRQTIKRRAMKDNGSFGSWDYDELANSWDDCPLVEWGVPAWEGAGQTGGDAVEENTTSEDNFDVKKEEIHVVCKQGDIWILGEHRLMCGDSISLEEVNKLCGGG